MALLRIRGEQPRNIFSSQPCRIIRSSVRTDTDKRSAASFLVKSLSSALTGGNFVSAVEMLFITYYYVSVRLHNRTGIRNLWLLASTTIPLVVGYSPKHYLAVAASAFCHVHVDKTSRFPSTKSTLLSNMKFENLT